MKLFDDCEAPNHGRRRGRADAGVVCLLRFGVARL